MGNGPFEGPFSTMDNPRLEFALEIRLAFPRAQMIANTPAGGNRSAAHVDQEIVHERDPGTLLHRRASLYRH